jgi:hypothetical protein
MKDKAQNEAKELTAVEKQRGVRGDDNPHPETKFEGKRCIACGKFFFTDIASDKCIHCIPDRIT